MSRAQCLDCEDIIESKHRHDFVKCGCGRSFLDGGDVYIRAGGNIAIIQDGLKLYPLQQDPELSKLLMDAIDEDFFDGYLDDDFDNYLDEDFEDFNLGFQAGVMDERERIIRAFEQYKGIKPLIDWTIKIVKGEQ